MEVAFWMVFNLVPWVEGRKMEGFGGRRNDGNKKHGAEECRVFGNQ